MELAFQWDTQRVAGIIFGIYWVCDPEPEKKLYYLVYSFIQQTSTVYFQ